MLGSRTLRGAKRGPLAVGRLQEKGRRFQSAVTERSLPLRFSGRAAWGLVRPAEAFLERRHRGASGARHFRGKDSQS